MFTKKELIQLIVIILLLGFIFGFNDVLTTLNKENWINNLIKNILQVAIILSITFTIQKLVAKANGAKTEIKLWTIKRPNLLKDPLMKFKTPFPIVVLFAIFFSFLSNGLIYFTGIFSTQISTTKSYLGRKHERLKEYQEALILLSVPLTLMGIIIISKILENHFGLNLTSFKETSFWISFFNMLPIPGLIGGRMFFARRQIFLFGISFIALTITLINIGPIITLILALILSFSILIIYYYFTDFGGELDWPNITPLKRIQTHKNIKKWQFVIIFLTIFLILIIMGTTSGLGATISLIGAFLIIFTYYCLKNNSLKI